MIGIGKWSFKIDTMMFRGSAILTIADKNGAYEITAEVPGMKMPPYSIDNIQEDGSILNAIVHTPLLSGKDLPVSLTFDGDVVTGYGKVPLLGKVKLKDGKRID
ncbi:MAG: hypothetical protein IKW76_09205 [Clostridia bacterium]|nr:hypothetical protein [Clostridia bacterium]